jgi:hypothetical protein
MNLAFIRAHGLDPSPTQRPGLAGLVAGAIAAAPALGVFAALGTPGALASSLGTAPLWIAAGVAAAMALAGALYGRIFLRAANDRCGGWLFGLGYGFLLWMLVPATALQAVLGRPAALGRPAQGLLAGHLAYGLALGLLYPVAHGWVRRDLAKSLVPRGGRPEKTA